MLTADNISAVPGRVGRPSLRRSPKLHSDVVAGEAPLYKRRASTGGLAELLDDKSRTTTRLHRETNLCTGKQCLRTKGTDTRGWLKRSRITDPLTKSLS